MASAFPVLNPEMIPPVNLPGTAENRPRGLALVSMPFGPLFLPSICIGLLKSAVRARGVPVHDFYFTFKLAERIGVHLYHEICNGIHSTTDLLGEWIFSRSLFGADAVLESRYVEDVLQSRAPEHRKDGWYGVRTGELSPERIEQFVSLRDQDAFLESCVETILGIQPAIAGFTSVFQQNTASLAAARLLKQRDPSIFTVMGGANCEGAMGLEVLRQFPFIDCVVSGEADLVFPRIVEAVVNREALPSLPGVHTRETLRRELFQSKPSSGPPVDKMDDIPAPDYEGFFGQYEASRPHLSEVYRPHVLFETSRGCYWGKVAHCTFCGLNGANMAFRSKSAARAFEELEELTTRYPGCPVTVVDNILDMQYFQSFVPELARRKLEVNLFYEVKANLKKEQVRLLRDAGILAIQPGIESLSTPILTEMRKGCTALQNIQLLKWCKEIGVLPIWNILWGFAREDAREYERMTRLVPLLAHLEPPQVAASLRLDRFSPYFENPGQFGLVNARPYPAYSYVYKLPEAALRNLAYYYAFDYNSPRQPSAYTRELVAAVAHWKEHKGEADLFFADLGEALVICDLRSFATSPFHVLTGTGRDLYLSCDGIRGSAALAKTCGKDARPILEDLARRGLMLEDGDSWLSLAVDLAEYSPSKKIRLDFIDAVRRAGRERDGEIEIGRLGTDGGQLPPRTIAQRPHALSAGHFRIDPEGRVLVNADALERIDLQVIGSLSWR